MATFTSPDDEERPTATVVGGGPAGLMAAEVLARAGVKVTVFDHKRSMGRKLILAGRGGLNLTHSDDIEVFLDRYGPDRPDLEPVVTSFGPDRLRAWCDGLGEATFVGTSGHVFPKSFKATPLLRAWLRRLDSQGVGLQTGHRWLGWGAGDDGSLDSRVSRFSGPNGANVEVRADVTVMALGGASWPRSGSDGGWVGEFVKHGIEVAPLRAANCGVRVGWSDVFVRRFSGEPIKNTSVAVAGSMVRGDAMVTDAGLEGGPIYAHSREIRAALDGAGHCRLALDLHPDLSVERLTDRLRDRRRVKDSMSTWMRRIGLAKVAVALLREATGNRIPVDSSELSGLIKAVPIDVRGLMPLDRAISTAGGVVFDELDGSLMLRKAPGVFLAGEMLDWEAPTGGYLLQASFSTAVAAARGALGRLDISGDSGYPRG